MGNQGQSAFFSLQKQQSLREEPIKKKPTVERLSIK